MSGGARGGSCEGWAVWRVLTVRSAAGQSEDPDTGECVDCIVGCKECSTGIRDTVLLYYLLHHTRFRTVLRKKVLFLCYCIKYGIH